MTLKFDIASDLHVDAWFNTTQLLYHKGEGPASWTGDAWGEGKFIHLDWNWYKSPDSRVLVIAGDVSNDINDTIEVVKDASEVYEYVVFVEGNHDHYQKTIQADVDANQTILRNAMRNIKNVAYLDGENSINIDGVLFIGTLGWYDWRSFEERGITVELAKDQWETRSRDARYPNYGVHQHPGILAWSHAELLRTQVMEAQTDSLVTSIVVVTHTSPLPELNEWIEGRDVWNALTPSYVNTRMAHVLDVDVAKKIKHWVYGHTHTRRIVEINGVIYSNNAVGYPRENEAWSMTQQVV
jgi:UDP-2,3-diacylglucosamine pyrophosphatase LpxH